MSFSSTGFFKGERSFRKSYQGSLSLFAVINAIRVTDEINPNIIKSLNKEN